MSDVFVFGVGAVLSADIAVPDHERELRFYSRVLGTGAAPLWRPDLMNSHGTPIIGLGPSSPELAHLPLQWMPHIQVADVRASATRALALGGRELMHGRDDSGDSQWAVLQDPNGAAFGVIPVVAVPPRSSAAPSSAEETPAGRIAWLDLTVPNASTTRDFYREVIGWTVEDVAMTDEGARYADYNMRGPEGRPVAGICHARGVNAGLPAVWMIYLPVGDLAESLRRVEEEGGRVLKTMRGTDGAYAYAAVHDPVGVHFALAPA